MRLLVVIGVLAAVAAAPALAAAPHVIACGQVSGGGGVYRVTITKGHPGCHTAKRVVRRWASGHRTRGWNCGRKVHWSKTGIYCSRPGVVVWAPSRNSPIIN